MDIFEQEYNAGLQKTAADQFEEIIAKMASEKVCEKCGKPLVKEGAITKCGCGVMKTGAAIDGADILNKVNPVDTTFGAPTDARSLEEGLRRVEAAREGRGKITTLAERRAAPRQQEVHRENTPLASGLSGFMEDPQAVKRMKTAAAKKQQGAWDRWGRTAATAGGLALGGVAAGGGALLAGRKLLRTQRAFNQQAQNKANQLMGDFMKTMRKELDSVHATTKGIQQASEGIQSASQSMNRMADDMHSTMKGVRSVTDDIKQVSTATKDAMGSLKQTADKIDDVPGSMRSYVGNIFGKGKAGSDVTATDLMVKAASEGRVRTLEGWNKTAADTEKDRYVRRVGREAAGMGAGAGIMGGGLAGAGAGAALGARRGHPVKGAIIGALGGAAAGGVGGGLGLKAIAERNAAKQSPAQRKAATRFNIAHARYQGGDLSREEYGREMGQFLKSRGLGHVAPKG